MIKKNPLDIEFIIGGIAGIYNVYSLKSTKIFRNLLICAVRYFFLFFCFFVRILQLDI